MKNIHTLTILIGIIYLPSSIAASVAQSSRDASYAALTKRYMSMGQWAPRLADKLEYDPIEYLNSDDELAKRACSHVLPYFNGQFKYQAQAMLCFTPNLILHKAECRQYWDNQKISYGYELKEKESVSVHDGDPLFPPIYMQDKDQQCIRTINGNPETAVLINTPRRVDINRYLISYVMNIVEEESLPINGQCVEVYCKADDQNILVPITLKENNFGDSGVRKYYYPNQKEEIEIHEAMLGKPTQKADKFEAINVEELLRMAGKESDESTEIFLKLRRGVTFLDSNFDRFPRDNIFIRCIIEAVKKEAAQKPAASSESSWIIRKMSEYKYPFVSLVSLGIVLAGWYLFKNSKNVY